jgi:hypothetical protein
MYVCMHVCLCTFAILCMYVCMYVYMTSVPTINQTKRYILYILKHRQDQLYHQDLKLMYVYLLYTDLMCMLANYN